MPSEIRTTHRIRWLEKIPILRNRLDRFTIKRCKRRLMGRCVMCNEKVFPLANHPNGPEQFLSWLVRRWLCNDCVIDCNCHYLCVANRYTQFLPPEPRRYHLYDDEYDEELEEEAFLQPAPQQAQQAQQALRFTPDEGEHYDARENPPVQAPAGFTIVNIHYEGDFPNGNADNARRDYGNDD